MKRGRNQRRRQGMNINRALDSNGPDVRIRGTANQIYDKYLALARDASSSGDRVKAENYLQHAEHYFRMIRAIQPAQPVQSDMDADGEQPSIGEGGDRRRRENGGADDGAGAAADSDEDEDRQSPREAKANGAAEHGQESEPRRRRRRPRRPLQGDDGETQEPAEDAAEAAAS